jgi:hypothetical protein
MACTCHQSIRLLNVQPPSADLLLGVRGVFKDVENRSRPFPPELEGVHVGIVSSQAPRGASLQRALDALSEQTGLALERDSSYYSHGALIGLVRFREETPDDPPSPWANAGDHHWRVVECIRLGEPLEGITGYQTPLVTLEGHADGDRIAYRIFSCTQAHTPRFVLSRVGFTRAQPGHAAPYAVDAITLHDALVRVAPGRQYSDAVLARAAAAAGRLRARNRARHTGCETDTACRCTCGRPECRFACC